MYLCITVPTSSPTKTHLAYGYLLLECLDTVLHIPSPCQNMSCDLQHMDIVLLYYLEPKILSVFVQKLINSLIIDLILMYEAYYVDDQINIRRNRIYIQQ
ncbi:Hypothetical protein CINCED_3A014004 [Cinara cedri]|uniref:Uncharacterized protein n=1 Tax=Cinara cedri TaxID=506608 RepID=A0A5E4N5J9_9HEMI|nr:Hypothetical protein CINCED_3A014004 [Cinara cedri]